MKIATFNINGIRARLPRLIEWLQETQPDVACLQEIKTQDEGFPIKDIEEAGYGAIWHGQKGFNGVAILAKGATPAEVARGLEGEPEDEHSRYIEAEVNGVARRGHLPAQWQSPARPQVRLQDSLDGAAARPRGTDLGGGSPGRACRRLQCHSL